MSIKVKKRNRGTISLNVGSTDTVHNIKTMVQLKEGIPVEEQRLTFGGRDLENSSPLSNYYIKHGSILNLEGMQIKVKTPSGKIIAMDVNPDDTVKDVKAKIKAKEGIPILAQRIIFGENELDDPFTLRDYNIQHGSTLDLDGMEISVKTHAGKILSINVNANDLVHRVTTKIEDMEGIPFDEQRLALTGNDLTDGRKLSDYNIQHGFLLTLGMQINIKDWNGKTFPLDFTREESISQLKQNIKDENGLPRDQQYLFFGGSQLEDSLSLHDCKIKHKSLVNLERIKIYVKTWSGETFTLFVKPTNTIEEIKDMVHLKEGYSLEQQLFLFGPTQLMGDRTLEEYDIPHKGTLFVQQGGSSSKAKGSSDNGSAVVSHKNCPNV
jgi:ubiquitin C